MMRTLSVRGLLLLTAVCSTLTVASAQQRFSAGPRVGINMSTFTKDASDYSFRPGVTAGAFLMYSSLNHFGISVDALYSQMGAKYSTTALDGNTPREVSFKQRINYLEVPVAFRYFLTKGGGFRPNVFFGPSMSFLLNAKTNERPAQGLIPAIPEIDLTDYFRKLDLGAMAGVQFNFPGFGERQRFLVDARYRYGLSDITVDNNANIHNSTVTLTLGYGFGVGPEYRSRYRK
ncbi:hypothetical protein GCM10027578_44740 [Spirosoma luteolum]